MELRPFTDWRNRGRNSREPVSMHHVDRFQPLPYHISSETPCWLNYSSSGGSITSEEPAGTPKWTYCPAGNWTYWSSKDVDKEAVHKKDQFERFDGYNNGLYILEWEDKWYLHRLDNWYLCNAICSALELTPAQKARVQFLFHSEDLERRGLSLDFVIFVLAALVCHKDGRKTYPHPNTKNPDELFDSFAKRHRYRPKLIRRWFNRFRDQLADKLRPDERRNPPSPPTHPEPWSLYAEESSELEAGT